jgi:anti-anti-sigma factor
VNQTLSTHATYQDGYTLARIGGELDVATAPVAQAFLHALQTENDRYLVVDVAGLMFTDAAGITVLLSASRLAEQRGGWLRLTGARPHLRRLLLILGLAALLPTYDTVHAAASGHPTAAASSPSSPPH